MLVGRSLDNLEPKKGDIILCHELKLALLGMKGFKGKQSI